MADGSDAAAALYVVGLPAEVAEEGVKGLFCVHGAVASVKMLPPNPKKPLGAAFVFFESADSAKSALSAQWAPPMEVVAKNAGWEAASESEDGALHVTGLPASVDDAKVKEIFAKFGTVKSAKVLKPSAERSDVAAIVCMSTAEEAKTLIDTVSGTTPDGLSAPIEIKAKLPSRRWGKGWGKGWGGGKNRAPPKNTVPEDFAVTRDQCFTGKVESYYKFNGYGFIVPDQAGLLPGDKVFVHWQGINSSDRFPSLTKDMAVQFSVEKVEKGGVTTLNAVDVALPGGSIIALQDSTDAEKKSFVGGQNLRYTGQMKFFTWKKGFGYIAIDDGFQYGDEAVPKEIRAELAECNAGGANPADMKETLVEFGIWKTKKGAYKAYNVTLPGGTPLPPVVPEAPAAAA